jgi:DNA end-binding protein Ku
MAARSAWKGSLKLSLITIPIRVVPATTPTSDISFHQFHRKCHTRIRMKRWCPHCDVEVEPQDIVKGHETSKGHVVLVEDEDIAGIRPESTRTVEISRILPSPTIDPVYIERVYFLLPESKHAASAFAVLREALEGQAGIGYLALHGREYLVAVLPRDRALTLYTLRTKGEVRDLADVEGGDFVTGKTRSEEVKLARQVLQSFEPVRDLSAFTDRYQEALKAMLAKKGDKAVVEVEDEKGRKVRTPVNLMEALRKSLEAAAAARKPSVTRAGKRRQARVLPYPSHRRTRKAG